MAKLQILYLNIKLLKCLVLWPDQRRVSWNFLLKMFLVHLGAYIGAVTCPTALIRQFIYNDDRNQMVDALVATVDVFGVEYMKYWFLKKIESILKLVEAVDEFEEFCPRSVIDNSEKKIRKYMKVLVAYAVLGNVINTITPALGYTSCELTRSDHIKKHDPCGLLARSFWPMDINRFPLFHMVFVIQIGACISITFAGFGITLFIMGILMHLIAQLQHLKKMLQDLSSSSTDIFERTEVCIKYHIKIIEYSKLVNEALGNQMLLHITLTSFIISVIGVQIVTVDSFADIVRFSLQLLGWLFLLLIICIVSQQLIDESENIAKESYAATWYDHPVKVQKDIMMIMMRAQKPLTMKAANLGVMSLNTFVLIIRSAYSYFTMLLNTRK